MSEDESPAKNTKVENATSSTSGLQILTLNTNKAGMDGLDTNKINEIIRNASEGSRFYLHKEKRQQELDVKLAQMKEAAGSYTEDQIKRATQQMDEMVLELESERDLRRTVVHVDMDMFYAAVEMRDDPSLRNKPMAVGGPGMLSTSNYAARRYGVRAAMPGFIGKKLCPELVIVPPHFDKYRAVSRQVQEVFAEYDPNFSAMSLDEAYLDITDYLHNSIQALQHESEGIAPNTRLAKVCSDMNKPNGQFYLPPDLERIQSFIATLPIRKVSGIGNVTEQHLNALGITQCSHLMEKRGLLKLLFSDTSIHTFMSVALGLGHTSLSAWTEKERKSISTETTFKGTSDRLTLFKLTEDLCQELADEMEQKGIVGKVFTLKIKTTDFQVRSRAQTLGEVTHDPEILATTAHRLLLHEMNTSDGPLSLRLLGVRMSSLMNAADMGPNRQATLRQMFSKVAQSRVSLSDAVTGNENLHHSKEQSRCMVSTEELPAYLHGSDEPSVGSVQPESSEKTKYKSLGKSRSKNHVKMKNLLIDQFLSKVSENYGAREMEQYECSVCGKLVKVKNLTEFNNHLDFCLENSASCDSDLDTSITDVKKAKSQNAHSDDYNIKWKPVNKHTEYQNIQSHKDTNTHRIPTESVTNVRSTSSECSSSSQGYLCPVCDQRNFSDYDLLNKHVDECLNKSAFSQMQREMDVQFRRSEKGINEMLQKALMQNQ